MSGTFYGIVLAHTVFTLPLVVLIVYPSLYRFDNSLEEAAACLGANKLQTLYRVTLPIVSFEIISAALFAFIVSFNELTVTLFISNINTITLSQRVWAGLRFEINPIIAAVSMFQILIITIIMLLIFIIKNKKG